MLVVYMILAAAAVLFIDFFRKVMTYRRFMNQLPGDQNSHFLLGDMKEYPGNEEAGLAWVHDRSRRYKFFQRFWTGPADCAIMVYHPQVLQKVIKHSTKPRNLGLIRSTYDMGVRWLGEGLLLATGPHWFLHRRLLTPSFHFDVLKRYVDIYNSCGDVLLRKISELQSTGQSVDFQPLMNKLTLDIILQCAFSLKTNCQSERESEYAKALCEIQSLWMKRWLNPLVFIEFIYGLTVNGRRFYKMCDVAHEETEKIIKLRQRKMEKEESEGESPEVGDFLDTLMKAKGEDGEGLSWKEMQNEVDTFLFAGHDTTASGIMWALYCLAQHPVHQEKVLAEVIEVMGDRTEVMWDDLGKLKFTQQCIKESLRLHGAVPGIERVTTHDLDLQGHRVKAGTRVMVHLWALHNNPHVWPEPFEFNPERFSLDNVVKMDAYQFMPFSVGSRNCIGQVFAMNEMKVTVAKVIRRFQLRADDARPTQRIMTLSMKSTTGIYMFAQPRTAESGLRI